MTTAKNLPTLNQTLAVMRLALALVKAGEFEASGRQTRKADAMLQALQDAATAASKK